MKLPKCHSCGQIVGGNCANSSPDFTAEMIIQYSGSRNSARTTSSTRRDTQADTGLALEPSARRWPRRLGRTGVGPEDGISVGICVVVATRYTPQPAETS